MGLLAPERALRRHDRQEAPVALGRVLSPAPTIHYFACSLTEVVALGALPSGATRLAADLHRRHVRFLSSLLSARPADPGERTYDLRIVSHPEPSAPACGRIEVHLLGRVTGVARDAAEAHAGEVLAILGSLFDEHVFQPVAARDIGRLLRPFPVTDMVVVSRRSGFERLDSQPGGRPGRPLGFGAHRATPPEDQGEDRVFHVYPFVPPEDGVGDLFALLLRQPVPMAVSIRLRPTSLTEREESFLEGQIARCERYGQVGLGAAGEDLDRLRPTFRDRARLLQQHLEPLLASLRAHAALLVLEVASPARVPMAVADAVGSLASCPVGGRSEGFFGGSLRGLAGGHRLLPVSAEDLDERAEAFGTLDVILPPDPVAPAGAPRLPSLIDPAEAAAAFRFPPAPVDDLPGLAIRRWRWRAAPAALPGEGTLLGTTVGENPGRPVRIGAEDRQRHAFVLGATGSGKTTLLKTMILDDMRAGAGLCVIDPHGDLFTELLARVPEHRIEDVIVLDPTDVEYPVGLNLLECEGEEDRHFVAQEVVSILTRLLRDEVGDAGFGHMTGPVFFEHLRMNLLLAMSNRDDPGTLLEFYLIFQERNYWRRWLPLTVSDPLLQRWVGNVLPATDYVKCGGDGPSMGAYVGSKFLSFTFDPRVRRIFGQKRSTLDLRAVMDEGKILLVNLAKGALTEGTARFLGMVVLTKLMAAAMRRLARPERDRREFRLYVDEFQSVATATFAILLSEARKFRVSSVLASQFVGQIGNPRITEAIFGNAGTLACFRLGLDDAGRLEPRFQPAVTRSDLVHLPNWHAYISTLLQGQPVRPFTIRTVEAQRPVDEARAQRVRDASRRKYTRGRLAVEAELAESARGPHSEAS